MVVLVDIVSIYVLELLLWPLNVNDDKQLKGGKMLFA